MTLILSRKRSGQQLARGFNQITALTPLAALPSNQFRSTKVPADAIVDPVSSGIKLLSLGRRAALDLIIFCMGVAAALMWQCYSDVTTVTVASSSPQTVSAKTAPEMVSTSETVTRRPMPPTPRDPPAAELGLRGGFER
jgi:hypothetical protein